MAEKASELAKQALDTLPKFGVRNVTVYGSKFLEGKEDSQLDMIITVQSSLVDEWHRTNIDINRKNYFLSTFPTQSLRLAQKLQYKHPFMFYHTKIPLGTSKNSKSPQYFKYGVVDSDILLESLESWSSFFIAGRYQKPTLDIDFAYDEAVKDQVSNYKQHFELTYQTNLLMAMSYSMLLLPEEFTEADLYFTISSLSYIGDVRQMFKAEDPDKIENMITKSFEKFQVMYNPIIKEFTDSRYIFDISDSNERRFKQNMPMRKNHTKIYLPITYQNRIIQIRKEFDSTAEAAKYVLYTNNRRETSVQLRNLAFMNSPLKSMKYVAAKYLKRLIKK